MNIEQMIAAARSKVEGAKSAMEAELTEVNVKAFEDANAELVQLKSLRDRASKATEELEQGSKSFAPERTETSFGERFTKSDNYSGFAKAYPTGIPAQANVSIDPVKVGSLAEYEHSRKAGTLTTSGVAHLPPEQRPLLDTIDRAPLSLYDLVAKGSIGTTSLEYLQIIAVERNAALIGENTGNPATDTLKPISDFATQLADAKVFGYADGYEVTNQLLKDSPALATFLNGEFRYSLPLLIQNYLLNGTGLNGQPRGLLNTTGVQAQDYTASTASAMPLVKAVRRAKLKLNNIGANIQAVLINPEDDAEIDLMQDGEDRFYGPGPFASGTPTLWGVPRVLSQHIDPGTAILGDFRQMALLDYEGLSVNAFNQHKDFAQRNLTYVRAELRAAQVIWRPNRFVVITDGA